MMNLKIFADISLLPHFFLLLQQGVRVRRRVGCSIDAFLRQGLGASSDTIEKIQSIMLDGKPVDDIASSLVHDGSTLALSAAMPGLVGATLRRGGAYASFRSGITYHEAEKQCKTGEGWVRVKIFNLLMAEMGRALLEAGVSVRASDVRALVEERAGELQSASAMLDDKPVDVAMLGRDNALAGTDQIFLTVSTRN